VYSPLEDFTKGRFKEVIDDNYVTKKNVKRVLFCSGKVYFDLLEEQQKRKAKGVAIIRLEQLHPFPKKQLTSILKKFSNPKLVWVQEESTNMGALTFFSQVSGFEFEFVSRKSSASPATGYSKIHKEEQADIVNRAFNI